MSLSNIAQVWKSPAGGHLAAEPAWRAQRARSHVDRLVSRGSYGSLERLGS
jgi:hypothetical protein